MRSRRRAWTLTARCVAALLLLRAVIPAGYMPDLGALRDGRLEITLCTADGLRTVSQPARSSETTGEAPADGPLAATPDDCPFGAVATQTLILPGDSALPPHGAARHFAPNASPERLDTSSQGPPLGARAPPFLLA